jgi:hypothetical protein
MALACPLTPPNSNTLSHPSRVSDDGLNTLKAKLLTASVDIVDELHLGPDCAKIVLFKSGLVFRLVRHVPNLLLSLFRLPLEVLSPNGQRTIILVILDMLYLFLESSHSTLHTTFMLLPQLLQIVHSFLSCRHRLFHLRFDLAPFNLVFYVLLEQSMIAFSFFLWIQLHVCL